jgi:hypothetical protein
MADTITADLIRTDGSSHGMTIMLEDDENPPSTIEHEGVVYGVSEYQAAKGVAAYHERK